MMFMSMKSKKVIIIGIGETADLAYNYFMLDSEYEVVAFATDKEYIKADDCKIKPVGFQKSENQRVFFMCIKLLQGRSSLRPSC